MSIKVLHLSSSATWRGGEQQIMYLVEESRKMGVDSIVACKKNSAVETYCKDYGLPFFTLSYKSGFDLKTALGIKRICEHKSIDLLHLHTAKAHTLAVLSGLLGLSIPMILSRRVDFAIGNNFLSRYKYNYKQIEKIICVSEAISRITGADIKDKSKLKVIYSGVDPSRFSESKGSLRASYPTFKDKIFIGNVSALADHKDYFTFIDTAEILLKNRKDLHFFIIGDGPLKLEIENYLTEKEIWDSVTMTGFLSNVPEVLPDLDLFLFTSKTEGLGTIVLDAFAAGVPVVATRAGGIPEMITPNENGLLSAVGDAADLAKNVLRVIEDENLRETFIKNARQRVGLFSKEATARQTLGVYKEILSKKVD